MKISSHHISSPAARAFTLIEILVAVGILAFILTSIYGTWTGVLRAADTGNRAAAVAQRERIARKSVEDALNSVQLFSQNQRYYSFEADTSGDFARLSLVSRPPAWFPGGGLFPPGAPRRIMFSVEPGKNRANQLILRQQPLLTPTNSTDPPYAIVLADNVNRFQMEFWDTNVNDWASEWLDTNSFPALARVALSFGPTGSAALPAGEISTTIIAFNATPITKEIQMPDAAQAGGGQSGKNRPPGGSGQNGNPNRPGSKGNGGSGQQGQPNNPYNPYNPGRGAGSQNGGGNPNLPPGPSPGGAGGGRRRGQ